MQSSPGDAAGGLLPDAPTVCPHHALACPTAVPSYAQQVAPIVGQYCALCHYAGSPYSNLSLTTYHELSYSRGGVLGEVISCSMPPANTVLMPDSARVTLIDWIECGTPDN